MTRVLLLHAGPTPWDIEDRLTGSQSLPLTEDANGALRLVLDALPQPVTGIYAPTENEACKSAAALAARKFGLRVRDNGNLEEWNLGLWEGLTRQDLRLRFPSIFEQWEENPFSVTPPEGESGEEFAQRLHHAVAKILKRNRDGIIALVLRPLAMQCVSGLLRHESPPVISRHFHEVNLVETIEVEEI